MILHLVDEATWRALPPGAPLSPPSLAAEGFVHCTAGDDLLLRVANAFYRDQPGPFVVLDVDEARLRSEVRWEVPPGGDPLGDMRFPHVYGPLDRAAIVGVLPVLRDATGTFLRIGDPSGQAGQR